MWRKLQRQADMRPKIVNTHTKLIKDAGLIYADFYHPDRAAPLKHMYLKF